MAKAASGVDFVVIGSGFGDAAIDICKRLRASTGFEAALYLLLSRGVSDIEIAALRTGLANDVVSEPLRPGMLSARLAVLEARLLERDTCERAWRTSAGEAGELSDILAVVPDMQSNGHDEVLIGGVSSNRSWIYFGGPDAAVTVVGSPCDQGTGFAPVISINGLPVVGASPVIGQTGASPNSLSVLFTGVIDPVGSPLGGCLVHLLASPAPVGVLTTVTDGAGAWVAPAISLPSPSLLGAEAAFQALTFTSAGPWEFSNALNLRVGW